MNAVFQPPDRYEVAARERIRRLQYLRAHPQELPALKAYYRTHIPDFINDWGVTVDPRNVGSERSVVMPFLLDPKQREWVEFTVANFHANKYGLTVKSRDVGVSWLIVAVSISLAVLFDDMAIGWGSFKREKVDWRGDLGSIFEKGRTYLDGLPKEFRGGYSRDICSFERRLFIPATNGVIIGEIGDNIGRGGRTRIYFVDETAYLEHDNEVDAALSKNTQCRQDVSSVHGMNNTFAQRAHQKSILENKQRFDFHWRDNPRMSQEDYEKFLETWGPIITAQELDMNFQASVEGIVIPALWLNACVDAHVKLGIKVSGAWTSALDVADQGIDKNAVAIRHGILLEHAEQWAGKESDIYATVEHAFAVCDRYQVRALKYDQDNVGAGVKGDARKVNEHRNAPAKITVTGFRGSAGVVDPTREMVEGRKNEDFFLNLKAQGWWALRIRAYKTYQCVKAGGLGDTDPDELLAIASTIPDLQKILIELSQPTYSQNQAGKLLIDKQPEGKPSPNFGDSVMMAYAPARKPMRINESEEI